MNKIKRSTSSNLSVSKNVMISPVFVFFLINAMQVGIGILGFERRIAKDAGYDAWISILVAGIAMHILLWMIYQTLQDGGGDLIEVHKNAFGKYIGGLLSMIFGLYFLLVGLTILRTYIEVIQLWVFPSLQIWLFTFVLLLLVYYLVSGGIRLVTGMCLISVIIGLPILWLKVFPIQTGDPLNLYPAIEHSIPDLLASAKETVLSFIGLELLFIYYPFIKGAKESKKWAHFGLFYTTLIYLVTAIVTFVYFSDKQLDQQVWATIALWKIVEFPFVERFEYVGIAMWLYVVLPNVCLTLWAASRIPKRLFNIRQKYVLWILCIVMFMASGLLNGREVIEQLNTITGQVGSYVLLYIPVLFCLTKILRKVRKKK